MGAFRNQMIGTTYHEDIRYKLGGSICGHFNAMLKWLSFYVEFFIGSGLLGCTKVTKKAKQCTI